LILFFSTFAFKNMKQENDKNKPREVLSFREGIGCASPAP
jgi:hypothetical protein